MKTTNNTHILTIENLTEDELSKLIWIIKDKQFDIKTTSNPSLITYHITAK